MKGLFLMIGLLLSSNAISNELYEDFTTVDVSLRSYHIGKRCYSKCTKKYNESNYGLGFSTTVSKRTGITLGFLQNSFDQTSYFGTINFRKTFRISPKIALVPKLSVGVANGYKDTPGKLANEDGIVPVLSPNISLYTGPLHMNVGILPSANTGVVIFRAGLRF